jgi:hypothetical protein
MVRQFAMAIMISQYVAGKEDAALCMFAEYALPNTLFMLASQAISPKPKEEATAPSD